MKLKNFLKLNFNNVQAEEYLKQTQLDEEMKKKTEDLRLRAQFDGVVLDQVNIFFIFRISTMMKKLKKIKSE